MDQDDRRGRHGRDKARQRPASQCATTTLAVAGEAAPVDEDDPS
jgi:hypothetical protein